jgi:hypothetical protein
MVNEQMHDVMVRLSTNARPTDLRLTRPQLIKAVEWHGLIYVGTRNVTNRVVELIK